MNKILLIFSLTLVFYVSPIIIKKVDAVYIPSRTPCSETGYKQPCNCLNENSWAKKRICNFRAGIKKGDFVIICADKSQEYADAIAKKVYKDCMRDHGF